MPCFELTVRVGPPPRLSSALSPGVTRLRCGDAASWASRPATVGPRCARFRNFLLPPFQTGFIAGHCFTGHSRKRRRVMSFHRCPTRTFGEQQWPTSPSTSTLAAAVAQNLPAGWPLRAVLPVHPARFSWSSCLRGSPVLTWTEGCQLVAQTDARRRVRWVSDAAHLPSAGPVRMTWGSKTHAAFARIPGFADGEPVAENRVSA